MRPINPLQLAKRMALAWFGTMAVLFALLFLAYLVPGTAVRTGIEKSVPLLQKEGLYPEYFGFKLFQMDNYTDTVMLFEAATADEASPLTAMMTNTTYNAENWETLPDDLEVYLHLRETTAPSQLAEATAKNNLQAFSYARYWHGYLIWVRPLLALCGYQGIRWIQTIVLAWLLALILLRLKKFTNLRTVIAFALSQLLVTVWWVPREIQFFTTFFLAYAGCLWVLQKHRPSDNLCVALVVLGACTAFCDLLVTPVLTLALPVAVWLSLPFQRKRGGWAQCLAVVGASLCWGVGYALCWASKWIIAGLVTGNDIIGDALHQAAVRTNTDTWHGIRLTWGNIFGVVFGTLQQHHLVLPLVVVLVLCLSAFCLCVRSRACLRNAMPLALTALMAPVWMAVLRTHSVQHMWFVWRNLSASIFAGLGFLFAGCSLQTGCKRLKQVISRRNRLS